MRVGGYVRLSRDEDRESYSSILSQKRIIQEYAMEKNWTILKYYEDDNHTGYSFDRPGFNELKRDLEEDVIDVVIAKDLSRIGRHNAQTLLFLDYIRKLDKRLILPGEGKGYDTLEDESDLLGITTWYNEMYVKDISRKIKGSMRSKQKEGKMLIREAFGYKKSPRDKHALVVDPVAASIVQLIFRLYIKGWGYRKIADYLNQEDYPTPSQYVRNHKDPIKCAVPVAESWNSVHVQRIIKNDIYMGTLRLAKTEKKTIKGKSGKNPEEKQYIFEDNHPAIIAKEEFEEARRINENRRQNKDKGAAAMENIFSGLLYCKDCGSYMIAYQKKVRKISYICGSYHKHGAAACQRHTVREEVLMQILRMVYEKLIQGAAPEYIPEETFPSECSKEALMRQYSEEKKDAKAKLRMLIELKLTEMKADKEGTVRDHILGSIAGLEQELERKLLYLDRRLGELENEFTEGFETQSKAHGTDEFLQNIYLEKADVLQLVEKIWVDRDGNPTIFLRASIEPIWCQIREDAN